MRKINFKWIIYLVVMMLVAATSAWADNGRRSGPHQGYSSGPHHGGQYGRHAPPHANGPGRFQHSPRFRPHGHHYYGRRAPWGYPHGRHLYPRHRYPHHGPFGHPPGRWGYSWHPRHRHYRPSSGGYNFSASILNPGFAFGFSTGSRW